MTRIEKLFAALEQTAPQPIRTAPWPLADVLGKMTLVHGKLLLLPLFKSRSEALTSLRGASYQSLLLINLPSRFSLQSTPRPRSNHRALARATARFWHASRALL